MVRTEEILKVVPEESTAIFRLVFKDENGDLVAPTELYWDLTAVDGTVIAYNQAVAIPESTTYIPIYGSNMRMLEGESRYGERLITFRGKYNSSRGNDLPIHKQIKFRVQNLALVGYPLSVSTVDHIFTGDYLESVGIG